MKVTLNRHLFTTVRFDSGALGVLASVVHQFAAPGRYQAVVRRNGVQVGATHFVVAETGPTQLNIDLSQVPASLRRAACDCHEAGSAEPTVSSKGYVLFYARRAVGGYSVVVGEAQPRGKAVFDSESLGPGDMYTLSLLAPARYTMTNELGSAKGQITVFFNQDVATRMKELKSQTQYVDVSRERFEPAEVSVAATQGLVFRVRDAARIIVEKQPSADTKRATKRESTAEPRKRLRIQRLRPPQHPES